MKSKLCKRRFLVVRLKVAILEIAAVNNSPLSHKDTLPRPRFPR